MSDKLNELENVIPEAEETVAEEVVEETEAVEEVAEEVAEETVEEVTDDFEEVIDENQEEIEEAADEVADYPEETVAEEVIEEAETPKKSKGPVIAIVAVIVVIAAIVAIALSFMGGNKYESDDYPPISGLTIGDVAGQMGVGVDEFLATYDLPADMPETTSQEAAFYLVPAKKFAEMNGLDFATLMQELNVPSETSVSEPKGFFEKIVRIFVPAKPEPITEETPWGVVLGEISVANYVGAENVEDFKTFYELDESVTGDTLYKEVRDAINKKTIELMAEQELLEGAEPVEGEEVPAEDAPAEEVEEAPAEEAPAEVEEAPAE